MSTRNSLYADVIRSFRNSPDLLVDVRNVSMQFTMPTERIDNIKEFAIKLIKRKIRYKKLEVLKDVNFSVNRGESLALIGRNGAGKSTLLKIISGIIRPTEGIALTKGNIVPLLKLGAGFDMNATGKENVFLNGAMMGFSHREMLRKYESIVEFSELGEFMNVPLKNYSSGMISRLGFSIAVDVNPDIMLIDEVLGVGDIPFTELPSFGSPFDLRGYYLGQYRDKSMAYAIVEYRHMFGTQQQYISGNFWSKLGFVAWFGTGTIGNTPLDWSKWKLNYGVGLRFQIQPGKNFRLDFGKDPSAKGIAFYMNMTEAF